MNNFSNILTLAQAGNSDLISIRKSISLAKKNQAHITVLSTRNKPLAYHRWFHKPEQNGFDNEEKIINLVDSAKHDGVSISYKVREERNHYIAVKKQLEDENYNLIVAEHQTAESPLWPFDRAQYTNLLSLSDTSILFVGEHQWLDNGTVLAAIETEENSLAHQTFNNEIIAKASDISKLLTSNIHLFNCYLGNYSISLKDIGTTPKNMEFYSHLEHLTALVKTYHFEEKYIHVEEGLADDIIPNQARKLNANVVVLGCGEHKGLLAKIKGHTIDYVLNKLDCDLLALKQSQLH